MEAANDNVKADQQQCSATTSQGTRLTHRAMSLDLPDRSSPSPAILANCNTTTAPATSAAKLPAAPAQIAHPPSQHLQVLSASSPDSPPHIKPEQPDNDGPLIHPANIDVSRKAFFVRGQLTTVSARTPQELSRKVNELERRNVWAEELVTKTFKSEQNMQRLIEAYSVSTYGHHASGDLC